MRKRIKAAKFVYCLSGWLMPIRTPKRTYRLESFDGEPIYDGIQWSPNGTAIKLLALSERLDPGHFIHWAAYLEPTKEIRRVQCDECGGFTYHNANDLNGEVTRDADA